MIPAEVLRECLRAATAAPSVHNTQPWRFRVHRDGVDVLVDRHRQLRTLDPDGREMFLSVGAAVFNLRVAVRAHGYADGVSLLPDPAEADLAARVRVGPAPGPTPAEAGALAAAIPHRHTNRRPFADRPVPYGTLEELRGAATAEGASLLVADPALREGLLTLTRRAENRMRADPRYVAELADWTTPAAGRRDGVPRTAFAPRDAAATMPLRDFGLGAGIPAPAVEFEPDPTLLLLSTPGDTTADWLCAGAALERVLLTATRRGLAATPLSQSMEIAALRRLLEDTATGEVAQTVLRIGYPTAPGVPTPRRDLSELLVP